MDSRLAEPRPALARLPAPTHARRLRLLPFQEQAQYFVSPNTLFRFAYFRAFTQCFLDTYLGEVKPQLHRDLRAKQPYSKQLRRGHPGVRPPVRGSVGEHKWHLHTGVRHTAVNRKGALTALRPHRANSPNTLLSQRPETQETTDL